MDRMIYVAMTGAKQSSFQQATIANNLANANTPGFRAELAAFRAVPATGGTGLPTRAFVLEQTTGADMTPGVVQTTGRSLDIALTTGGFFAVQTPSGEAYTRNGSLEIDPNGILRTRDGQQVQGDGGPISIPSESVISIGHDGTISASPPGDPTQSNQIGRIKLVEPGERQMERGSDGLFRPRDGQPLEADASVKLMQGALESSNVNAVEQLVKMIDYQRHYDMQVRLLQAADQNDRAAAQVLTLS
ncbi:flagellar basal-body rod protein FlgF [Chitinimonas lacunae]|uniref:Flagellar basal-body rod protein FlgF n=1 Tax=Chitinimonas lacunae TaxID=1963018 RepID=A0ABV8MHW4_9NEIS